MEIQQLLTSVKWYDRDSDIALLVLGRSRCQNSDDDFPVANLKSSSSLTIAGKNIFNDTLLNSRSNSLLIGQPSW